MDHTPQILKNLELFQKRFPNPQTVAFLMMRFGTSKPLKDVYDHLVRIFDEQGIQLCRADEYQFADDLWGNILTFMHGCAFGVAVVEQSNTRDYNPNVALEVGYMTALGKHVCILKEQSLPSVPTDLLHRLYIDYDHFNLPGALEERLPRWLRDHNLTVPCRAVKVSFDGEVEKFLSNQPLRQAHVEGIKIFTSPKGLIRFIDIDCDPSNNRCTLYFEADSFAAEFLRQQQDAFCKRSGLPNLVVEVAQDKDDGSAPANVAFWDSPELGIDAKDTWQACMRECFEGQEKLTEAVSAYLPAPTADINEVAVFLTKDQGGVWYMFTNYVPFGYVNCAKLATTRLANLNQIIPKLVSLSHRTIDCETKLISNAKLLESHAHCVRYLFPVKEMPQRLPVDSGGAMNVEIHTESMLGPTLATILAF